MDGVGERLIGGDEPDNRSDYHHRSSLSRTKADLVCMVTLFGADAAAFMITQALTSVLSAVPHAWLGAPVAEPTWLASFWSDAMTLFALFCASAGYLTAHGCYRERLPFWNEMRQFVLVSTFALLAECFVEIALKSQRSRLMVVGVWILFPFCVAVLRPLAKRLLFYFGLWQLPILVIGQPKYVHDAEEVLGSERLPGYRVVASLTPGDALALSDAEDWQAIMHRSGAERLAVSLDLAAPAEAAIIQSILRAGVPFFVLPQISVLPVVGCEHIPFFSHDTILLSYRNNLAQPGARTVKALFDLGVAGLLMILLSPVFLILVLLIRRDGGPAFYSHRRVGRHGRSFGCLKFRTMVTDSDLVLERALAADETLAAEWNLTQKLRRDPRITAVGRILRATSLDELPQLINVLRFQMSLVGPRPIVDAEIARYGDDIAFYYETRPGLTGLWQVSGRADTTYPKRVRLDCWYVKNWTMWHDVAILSKTIPAVLVRRGAH